MPQLLPRKAFAFGELLIPGQAVWSFALAAAIIMAFTLYFRYSRTGIAMRAAASDPVTAYVLGIDVRATQRLTWMFAGIVGAMVYWPNVVIGTVTGYLLQAGLAANFFSFTSGHSAFELSAIVLCGAAGLRIGHALVAPGRRLRADAPAGYPCRTSLADAAVGDELLPEPENLDRGPA